MANSDKPFIVPIFIPHAGCPHRCVFCDQSAITGVRSTLPPRDLHDQIERFLKFKRTRRGAVQIAFFGGNFLGLPADEIKRLLAAVAKYVFDGRANGIRFSTRPDTIDRKRLKMIKNFPVSTIELGVQSMDDRVLRRTCRGHTVLDTRIAIQNLRDFDYEIGVQLMVGLPGDTPERLIASARRVARLKPDFIRIYPTLVLKDSPLAGWYRRGDYVPLNLETAVTLTMSVYRLFRHQNIRVIRMGLQASDVLENGSAILAGPYHPAFGHLVYSEIFLDMAVAALECENFIGDRVALRVHPQSISKMKGLKNRNMRALKEKFGLRTIAVIPDVTIGEESLAIGY